MTHKFSILACAALVSNFVVLLAGCGKQAEVGKYTAPKDVPPDTTVAVGEATPEDRMLAALVPHGERAWFFKLVGPQEAVSKNAEVFENFVQSVKFAKDADATPEWTLPVGWERVKSETEKLRFATLKIPDDNLEVTVSFLGWPANNYVDSLHANINRWRGQMQLKKVRADELPDAFSKKDFADKQAFFVDLKGKQAPAAMSPSAAAAGAGEMPAGHPPVTVTNEVALAADDTGKAAEPAKVEIAQAAPQKSQPEKAAEKAKATDKSAAPAQEKLPFEFEAPADWTAAKAPMFAVAAFETKDRASGLIVSVTPMMGAGGDLLGNLNRWRAQLSLPAIGEADLATVAPDFKVGGKEGKLAKLVMPKEASQRQAITAALVKDGDTTWIFRMRGTAESVEKQQANFEKFLSSIKFSATKPDAAEKK